MAEIELKIRPATRNAANAVERLNKKLERMIALAGKAGVAIESMQKTTSSVASAMGKNSQVSVAKQTTRQLAQEEKKRVAEAKRSAREQAAAYKRAEAEKVRAFKKAERERAVAKRKELRARQKSFNGLKTSAGAALGIIGGLASAYGAFGISEGKKSIAFQERLTALKIQGRNVGEKGVNEKAMASQILTTSQKSGIDYNELTSGLEEIVTRTGDLNTALKSLDAMAEVASATGADVKDLGGATAELMTKFGMKEPEEFRQSLAMLAMMGKKGAFELKDLAANLPEVAAAAKGYGASGTQGMKEMAAMLQIARSGTGSGEEAATAMRSLYSDLTKSKGLKELKRRKINVFDTDKKTGNKTGRSLFELLPEIMRSTGGNADALNGIFNERSKKAVLPLADVYKTKLKETGSKDDATKAVVDALNKAANAEGALSEIKRDAAEKQKSSTAKWNAVWSSVQAEMLKIDWAPIIEAIPLVGFLLQSLAKGIVAIVNMFYDATGQTGQKAVFNGQVAEREALNDKRSINAKYNNKIKGLGPITDANRGEYDKLVSARDKEMGDKKVNERLDAAKTAQEVGKKAAENSYVGSGIRLADAATSLNPIKRIDYMASGEGINDIGNIISTPIRLFAETLLGIDSAAQKASKSLESINAKIDTTE